jgi:hypothetical protein
MILIYIQGSLAQPLNSFALYTEFVLGQNLVPDSLLDVANETLPGINDLPLGDPADLGKYSVNMRDNIPQGDNTQTPLQFVFEPANCKIFYDFMTASHPHMLWERAADIAWKGKKCAWGGMNTNVTVGAGGNSTSTPGNGNPSTPLQVTANSAGRNAVFSTMGAVVGAAAIMGLI